MFWIHEDYESKIRTAGKTPSFGARTPHQASLYKEWLKKKIQTITYLPFKKAVLV
jgi:hypothetical protein